MNLVLLLVCFLYAAELARSGEIEKTERVTPRTWYLGMNLNPADGHVMGYTVGWADDVFIGRSEDYLNREVWHCGDSRLSISR